MKTLIHRWFKPTLECLTTHQFFWKDLDMEDKIPTVICKFCGKVFKYPTRKEEYPVYRK